MLFVRLKEHLCVVTSFWSHQKFCLCFWSIPLNTQSLSCLSACNSLLRLNSTIYHNVKPLLKQLNIKFNVKQICHPSSYHSQQYATQSMRQFPAGCCDRDLHQQCSVFCTANVRRDYQAVLLHLSMRSAQSSRWSVVGRVISHKWVDINEMEQPSPVQFVETSNSGLSSLYLATRLCSSRQGLLGYY